MKLSARWTKVSFLAVSALAVAAFAGVGCTVTSGDVDDDGGTFHPIDNDDDDGGADDDGGTTPDTDSGSDAGVACAENTNQAKPLVSTECQACLNANCCTELTTCFDIDPNADPDAGADGGVVGVDCNDFADCVADCFANQGGSADCIDTCNLAAAPGVSQAYDDIVTCAENSACAACGT